MPAPPPAHPTRAPRLIASKRRGLALLLGVLALAEALLAVLLAGAIDRALAEAPSLLTPPLMPLLAASGYAVMLAASVLLARWVGEDFAQSYIADCRAAILAEAIRPDPSGAGAETRWLTVLLNDMPMLRHSALGGAVQLGTSLLAGGAAAGWIALTMPPLRPALLPLLLAGAGIVLLLLPLTRAIAAQRGARGRLERVMIARARGAAGPEAGRDPLDTLVSIAARTARQRARGAGWMDALAMLGGLLAALGAVLETRAASATGIAGSLLLLGYIAARLLAMAHALHARASGRSARARLAALLPGEAAPRPEHIIRALRRVWTADMRQRTGRVLALPGRRSPRLPAPARPGEPQEPGA
jgi:hypothetical protein